VRGNVARVQHRLHTPPTGLPMLGPAEQLRSPRLSTTSAAGHATNPCPERSGTSATRPSWSCVTVGASGKLPIVCKGSRDNLACSAYQLTVTTRLEKETRPVTATETTTSLRQPIRPT